jgi:hypothetical protein
VQVVINPDTKKPISPVTLRKYFRAELDRGHIQTKMRVGGALVRAALGVAPTEHHAGYAGNVTAMIFYLKTQAGWKEGEPPPPPPGLDDEDVDLQDAGRRIAFALAAAERAPAKALPAPKKAKQTA